MGTFAPKRFGKKQIRFVDKIIYGEKINMNFANYKKQFEKELFGNVIFMCQECSQSA